MKGEYVVGNLLENMLSEDFDAIGLTTDEKKQINWRILEQEQDLEFAQWVLEIEGPDELVKRILDYQKGEEDVDDEQGD